MTFSLKLRSLPATITIDNFVEGIGPYSYELYLLELINSSQWARKRFGILSFIEDQSHGEADCKSDRYELDFKRIDSSTHLQAISIFSDSITKDKGGWIVYGSPQNPNGRIMTTRLYAALRGKTQKELFVLAQKDNYESKIDEDIARYLHTIVTRKNLFLFFPYQLFFDEEPDYSTALNTTIDSLEMDFRESMKYREYICKGSFDTFFSYVYQESLVVLEWADDKFTYQDSIALANSNLYSKLLDYYRW